MPVERRGVEMADARVPRGVDRRPGVVVGDAGEQVADRRAPEPERGGHFRHTAPSGYTSAA